MKKLYEIYSKAIDIETLVPAYDNINIWFSKNAINKLAKLKYAIQKS